MLPDITESTVIFLDIDGVLINRKSLMKASGLMANADPECVANLNKVIQATGALVVVSSTWRMLPFMELKEKLYGWGLHQRCIFDVTPPQFRHDDGSHSTRGDEIFKWLKGMEWPKHIIIIDDDSDMGALGRFLYQTSVEEGLTDRGAHNIMHNYLQGLYEV